MNIRKLSDLAHIPTKADDDSAGFDLYAVVADGEATVLPGQTLTVGSGYAFEIPQGYFGGVFPRSGISTKHGIRLSNCVAVIDSSYRGEVKIPLYNDSGSAYTVRNGDRVAQLIIIPYHRETLVETDKLSDTDRGDQGFGHSGR